MGVEVSGGGPFVTVVSVDGGSLSGNKLTVKTPAASPVSSTTIEPEPESSPIFHSIPSLEEDESIYDKGIIRGSGAYVTVVALGKEKRAAGEKTSVVNILNEVEKCLKQNFPEFLPLLEDQKRKSFVSIEDVEEDLIIYRLPGERLGLGLRFEGGEDPQDPIDRLFIESCVEGSPAQRTFASWGPLGSGDEVLAIGGLPVSLCSRQGLIDALRESPVALTVRIRHLRTHEQTERATTEQAPSMGDESDSHHLLSQIQESLTLQAEELQSWGEVFDESVEEEPFPVRWSREEEIPVPPPRRLGARDSLKYYRNQRPLSLNLDLLPPEGFADFQLRLKTLSLENIQQTLMRSRSALGLESPLDPPPSFQDEIIGVVGGGGKKGIVRSRSLVNITHEEPEEERGLNHPEEHQGDEGEEADGNEEEGEDENEGDEVDAKQDEERDELDSFAEELGGEDDGSSSGGGSSGDGEVTIRIEWLHEIQEEEYTSPSPPEGETGKGRPLTAQRIQEEEEAIISITNIEEDSVQVHVDDVNTKGKHLTNELLLLRTLPLATIQLDQDPIILPITDRHASSTSGEVSWTEQSSKGMDISLDFAFLPPPPTHARLPPDGHESPNNMNNNWAEQNYAPPPLPDSQPPDDDPPPLPTSGPPASNQPLRSFHHHKINEEPTENNTFEPSIKSVKDKIALFSSSSTEDCPDYQRTSINNNYPITAPPHHMSETNLTSVTLLEERRKSLSRLRGLVLDKPQTHSPLLDLPPIRSKDAPLITSTIPKIPPKSKTPSSESSPTKEIAPENANQWRVPLPKYSPAFKRRTLSPYVPKPPPRPLDTNSIQQIQQGVTGSMEELIFSTPPNGKEEKDESDKDSAVPSSPPSSLPQEITPCSSPLPQDETETEEIPVDGSDALANGDEEEEEESFSEPKEFLQSPLQAIYDMEVQMAYINEICDALPSGGGGFFHKRRDSEATVIERPIGIGGHQEDSREREREHKSPGREILTTALAKESPVTSTQWSQSQSNGKTPAHPLSDKVLPKVTGILEKKIERIIEKTSADARPKTSSTSIPRGRNDFKSLAQKWQQISTQEKKPTELRANEFITPQRKRTISVNDIRKAFETPEDAVDSYSTEAGKGSPPELLSPPSAHFRVSSFDSTTSEESSTPGTSFLSSVPRDPYGSITSLASSTSLISPQELQQLIEEANQSLEEAGTPTHEVSVVILHREFPGGSLGITLAGGADYETKEITVHKVLTGSIADRDGRIYRGDRVLSINGKNTKGLTHREALNLLKAPRCEVVLVVSRGRSGSNSFSTIDETMVCLDRAVEPLLNGTLGTFENEEENPHVWGPTKMVILVKDGAGLGFSLDGGKGSILGDKPLTIKKIFVGGPAEKSRGLSVGDLITAINGTKMSSKSRTEAWNFMKKLGDGEVRVSVRSPILS